MIPPSYLFKDFYRRTWLDADEAPTVQDEPRPGLLRRLGRRLSGQPLRATFAASVPAPRPAQG